jgi:protease-4
MLSTGTYALSTAASQISVVPTGIVWLTGFYGEAPYLREMLHKIGCTPDFETCGDFKTAAETLTRDGPSQEAQRMTDWLLDDIYHNMVALIADGRSMTPEKVKNLIDQGPYTAEEALVAGLIDSVQHRQDFVADLKAKYGGNVRFAINYGKKDPFDIPDDNFFAMFEFFMKMMDPEPTSYTEPSVAIVYVEGAIQTGTAEQSPFGGTQGAFSTTIRKALDKAAEEDSVKAVVLRVDSPGGSALASEIILDASKRVAAKKPLVVSMGNVAGSGGYYVTCGAGTIFASPSTVTASIGVVAGKIVTTGMWDKLGINWHANQRGDMAGMLSTASKFSPEERAKLRDYMTMVYRVFRSHVEHAREGKLTKPMDELAGGRVFTGRQALELGLVDKLGGLEDAVKYAAGQAGIGEYDVRVIPEPPTIFDLFAPSRKDESISIAQRGSLSLMSHPIVEAALPLLARTDPLRFKAVVQALVRIELIHREGVVMMMPEDLIIR